MKYIKILTLVVIILIQLFLIFTTISSEVYSGDSLEFVASTISNRVPHPPGFPLYMMLLKIIVSIPISQYVWKISLFSFVMSVNRSIVIYLIIKKITSHHALSILVSLLSFILFPNWLYASIPETLSFSSFLYVLILYVTLFYTDLKHKYVIIPSLLGISFFHHYLLIVTIIPLLYVLYQENDIKSFLSLKTILLFLIGILPYTYFLLVKTKIPWINYINIDSVLSLFKLITRSPYGAFNLSSSIYFSADTIVPILTQLITFVVNDFKFIGVFLIIIGMFSVNKVNKKVARVLFLHFLVWPLFFVYASFPLENEFQVGTFEKFLLFPYTLLVLFIPFGILELTYRIQHILQNNTLKNISINGIYITLILLIFILITNNYKHIKLISEKPLPKELGNDMIRTISDNSIVGLVGDNVSFSTLYSLSNNHNKNIKYVYFEQLTNDNYRKNLIDASLELREYNKNKPKEYIEIFIKNNSKKYTIYHNIPFSVKEGEWFPEGLLLRYYPKKLTTAEKKAILKREEPRMLNIISKLKNYSSIYSSKLLLSKDIFKIYSNAIARMAINFGDLKDYEKAIRYLQIALDIYPPNIPLYPLLSNYQVKTNKCNDALKTINMINVSNKLKLVQTEVLKGYINIYSNCFHDTLKAEKYVQEYIKLQQK